MAPSVHTTEWRFFLISSLILWARAAQAIADDFEDLMNASHDGIAGQAASCGAINTQRPCLWGRLSFASQAWVFV